MLISSFCIPVVLALLVIWGVCTPCWRPLSYASGVIMLIDFCLICSFSFLGNKGNFFLEQHPLIHLHKYF